MAKREMGGVSCGECGLDLDEDPSAPPDTRTPCPDCGSLSRQKRLYAEDELRIEALPPRVLIRNYFSSNMLWTAIRLASMAREIEASHPKGRSRFDIAHRGYVIASINASVAFLEANVNELFQDAYDGHTGFEGAYIGPLSAETVARLKLAWQAVRQGSSASIFEKFDLALTAADRSPLDRSSALFADAQALIGLRNSLVHYRPESVSSDVGHKRDSLRNRFPPNALMEGSGNAWWPDHCLGAGSANWAVMTARALADHLADELNMDPNYRRLEAGGWIGDIP